MGDRAELLLFSLCRSGLVSHLVACNLRQEIDKVCDFFNCPIAVVGFVHLYVNFIVFVVFFVVNFDSNICYVLFGI